MASDIVWGDVAEKARALLDTVEADYKTIPTTGHGTKVHRSRAQAAMTGLLQAYHYAEWRAVQEGKRG